MRQLQRYPLIGTIGVSTVVLFLCSSIRHALFNSSAWDLGIFDQAIYLISQGLPPVSSFLGFHILGDHATWIFYPLALLYRLYPNVHWLFAVQAVALATAAWPVWSLAKQAGCNRANAHLIMRVYLLYPLVFNVNLADFHPEVIALPALFWAVLLARSRQVYGFVICLLVILGCKAVLGLTVVALGIWLMGAEKNVRLGGIACVMGLGWFLLATQWILPTFGPGASAIARQAGKYTYLGPSLPEIVIRLLTQPHLVLHKVFAIATLEYLALLAIPVLWGLSFRHLGALIPALPALALNILSESSSQRNLVQHYSIPVLPFLLLVVIATMAAQQHWLKSPRVILVWSCVSFLVLAKYGYFGSVYLQTLDNWQASRTAIARVQTQGAVLTTDKLAPHLTHRTVVQFTDQNRPTQLDAFDYVLLNVRHPGWLSDSAYAANLVQQVKHRAQFQQIFAQDQVYLFQRIDPFGHNGLNPPLKPFYHKE
jgi:uncharacterized membrane protein